MKMYLSAFLSLLLLLAIGGCSKEQFGTAAQTYKDSASSVLTFEDTGCSNFTLIKPKVDILYVVDNSTSTLFLGDSIKSSIKQTVDSISSQFDYRIIGTQLIPDPTDATPYNDYQILTNSTDLSGIPTDSRRVSSSSDLNFFAVTANGTEKGMSRSYNFINSNRTNGLFRTGTHLLVILISNGRDTEVESTNSNGSTQSTATYTTRLNELKSLKTSLSLQQLRFFSITAKTQVAGGGACQEGWVTSFNSYVKASKDLYLYSLATDSSSQDSYDLCPQGGGLSGVYAGVNSSIQQLLIAHKYKYWPITFADANESILNFSDIQVFKYSPNAAPVLIPKNNGATWDVYTNANYPTLPGLNTRSYPTAGEPVNVKFFVEFKPGNEITYPDCVVIKSSSNVEFFQYIALSQKPVESSIVVSINGVNVPASATNGWSYDGGPQTKNIKADNANPPIVKSGFMIKLNGASNYYKSGDNVEVGFTPAAI